MYEKHFDALLAAWNEGDLDALDEYLSKDVSRVGPRTMDASAEGLNDLKDHIRDFRKAFPDTHVAIDELLWKDDRSICRWTFSATNTGEGDFPPTGRRVVISGSSIARYENDKLVQEYVYFDVLDFMTQLGVIEVPKAAASGGGA